MYLVRAWGTSQSFLGPRITGACTPATRTSNQRLPASFGADEPSTHTAHRTPLSGTLLLSAGHITFLHGISTRPSAWGHMNYD